MWCEALFSPQKNPSVKLRVESRCCRARIALLLTRRTHVNDREGTMVKFLKVRVLQRTPPDPPRGRASRDERPTPAMRRPAARSPRCLPSPRAPASDAGAPRRGDRARAGPSAPPDRRVAMPPSARVADSGVDAAATDARARSTRTRAEPRWRCFFPVASARKRRSRDDRDAIDAERRARRRTRRASRARRRSVVHRRRAGAAGRRAGLRSLSRVFLRWRSQLRAVGGGRLCRSAADPPPRARR
jgi:hypothetical protein